MKVHELIQQLLKFHPDLEVIVWHPHDYDWADWYNWFPAEAQYDSSYGKKGAVVKIVEASDHNWEND